MPAITDLSLFIAAGLLLNITPGADMLYVLSRGAAQGPRAGVVAALGIGTGCCGHIVFAVLGLSAILAASSLAFSVLKYVGAIYLIYLGVTALRSLRSSPAQIATRPAAPLSKIFREAVLINLLNPKVALFFLAFLPQFVSPHADNKALTLAVLGVIFNINGTLVNIVVGAASGTIAGRMRGHARLARWLKGAMGGVLILLGVRLALSERN